MKRAQDALYKLSRYSERPSELGVFEAWIFNVCCLLLKESDEELIENVLADLINGIHSCDSSGMDIERIADQVVARAKFYPEILKTMLQDPVEYDLKPLYCAWYRYPFTDVQYAVAEPNNRDQFRLMIARMMNKLMR